jgi:hypothetical protein
VNWTELGQAVALCGNGDELLPSYQNKGPCEFNKIYAVKQRPDKYRSAPTQCYLLVAPNPHTVS